MQVLPWGWVGVVGVVRVGVELGVVVVLLLLCSSSDFSAPGRRRAGTVRVCQCPIHPT